jgi:hypothetical protein
MKQTREVLEHGWTRGSGTQIAAANLTVPKPKSRSNTTRLFNALSRQWVLTS